MGIPVEGAARSRKLSGPLAGTPLWPVPGVARTRLWRPAHPRSGAGWLLIPALLACAGGPASGALSENDYFQPLGRPPEAKRERIKGGEAFPPLPLPATPLRRSERKREPAPPTLIGKVVWGASADVADESGQQVRISDWNLVPADCQQLLKKAAQHLSLQYRQVTVQLNSFSGDPSEIPVLFFSGGRRLQILEEQQPLLRKYVLNGGMLWFDCVAGSPFFYESSLELLRKLFPEEPLRRVPADHPLYHMMSDVERVRPPEPAGTDRPQLEAVYAGCRLGAVVSKFGLGCGWDNFTPDYRIKQALYYDVKDATRLGLNLLAYAVGYHQLGLAHSRPELFGDEGDQGGGDPFLFAQVRHGAVWNTDPGGPATLLRTLATETSVKVAFRRRTVQLGTDSLQGIPFLYLAGCHELKLAEAQIEALRGFLGRGGTLLVDNAQGLGLFDQSLRAMLKQLLPGAELKPVPASHPIFSSYHRIEKVSFTPALRALEPERSAPGLEGIELDGDLRVLYSRYDLGGGWQGSDHPQARGYSRPDALRLGVNIVVYAMTH